MTPHPSYSSRGTGQYNNNNKAIQYLTPNRAWSCAHPKPHLHLLIRTPCTLPGHARTLNPTWSRVHPKPYLVMHAPDACHINKARCLYPRDAFMAPIPDHGLLYYIASIYFRIYGVQKSLHEGLLVSGTAKLRAVQQFQECDSLRRTHPVECCKRPVPALGHYTLGSPPACRSNLGSRAGHLGI